VRKMQGVSIFGSRASKRAVRLKSYFQKSGTTKVVLPKEQKIFPHTKSFYMPYFATYWL